MLFINCATISQSHFMMLKFVEGLTSQSVHEIDGVVLVAGGVRVHVDYFVDYAQVVGNCTDLGVVNSFSMVFRR